MIPGRLLCFLSSWLLIFSGHAEEPAKNVRAGPDGRGAMVFKKYCVLCHGAKAEGDGIAAKFYNPRPANLRLSTLSDAQKDAIIRKGGGAVGRSENMPPWGEELSDRQIRDVIAYLRTVRVARR